jgi:branched-chain amino acid transport system permease protein
MRALFITLGGDNVALAQSIDQLRKPIFGLLLVLMMLTRPQGLFGTHEVWDLFRRPRGARA